MRVLITGAAGFLGSNLCDLLLSEGHDVIGMDNFITGKQENLAHLAGNDRFSFFRHDVSKYIFIAGFQRRAFRDAPRGASLLCLWNKAY